MNVRCRGSGCPIAKGHDDWLRRVERTHSTLRPESGQKGSFTTSPGFPHTGHSLCAGESVNRLRSEAAGNTTARAGRDHHPAIAPPPRPAAPTMCYPGRIPSTGLPPAWGRRTRLCTDGYLCQIRLIGCGERDFSVALGFHTTIRQRVSHDGRIVVRRQ